MAGVRNLSTVYRNLQEVLSPNNPPAVDFADLVSKHVAGGQPALDALPPRINSHGVFKQDGLNLEVKDVPLNPIVFQLYGAIIGAYRRQGIPLR